MIFLILLPAEVIVSIFQHIVDIFDRFRHHIWGQTQYLACIGTLRPIISNEIIEWDAITACRSLVRNSKWGASTSQLSPKQASELIDDLQSAKAGGKGLAV